MGTTAEDTLGVSKDNVHKCNTCDKTFSTQSNLYRHERIHSNVSRFACTICNNTFKRSDDLKRHLKTHNRVAEKRTAPALSEHQEHPAKLKRGRSILSPIQPTKDDLEAYPEDVHSLIRQHWHQIRTHVIHDARVRLYNYQLRSGSIEELKKVISDIHDLQTNQYKLNFALGFILKHRVTDEVRYFHASHNTQVFENGQLIQNRADTETILNIMEETDPLEYARKKRPDSAWTVDLVTNMLVYVTPIRGTPIGNGVDLPDFILKKKHIAALHKNFRGVRYTDKLCFFRCLAMHYGYHANGLEHKAKQLFHQYMIVSPRRTTKEDFEGVPLEDLRRIEVIFKVNINVYELREYDTAEVKRRSTYDFPFTMYLNLYKDHFSLITSFSQYTKQFRCRTCEGLFRRAQHCSRHERTCQGGVKYVYPGGVFKTTQSIFDRIKYYGFEVHPDTSKTYDLFATYDIECFFKDVTDQKNAEKLKWVAEHHLLSIGMCSNVPNFTEPICLISDGDSAKLVKEFVDHLTRVSDAAFAIMQKRYSYLYDGICEAILKYNHQQQDNDSDQGKTRRSPLEKLRDDLYKYMRILPIIGFNSSRYDINALKTLLFPELMKQTKIDFVTKKDNSYMSLTCEKFSLRDIQNYLSAGTSYAKFLKAFNVPVDKGFFCYEYVRSIEQLNEKQLPPYSAFYSELKGSNITKEDYKLCLDVWKAKNMSTLRDFRIHYMELDVYPMVQATEKMVIYFQGRGLDMFKDGISLPGLAMKDLFKDTGTFFSLASVKDKYVHDIVERNIVGGPSIIVSRHHEKNKTRIRHHEFKEEALISKSVFGFDAIAMYLNSLMQAMPTGYYAIRSAEKDYRLVKSHKYGRQAREWLNYREHIDQVEIIHQHRNGQEVKLGWRGLPVDGYAHSMKRVYEFSGCEIHGHDCHLTRDADGVRREFSKISGEKMADLAANTEAKFEYIKNLDCELVEIYECEWWAMKKDPAVKAFIDRRFGTWSTRHPGKMSLADLIERIRESKIFGMVHCDIEVPEELKETFAEFPPIFKTCNVSRDDIGDFMGQFAEEHGLLKRPRKMLIGSMFGKDILLATPLVQWYLNKNLVITNIHAVIEYEPMTCFKKAGERVAKARRAGDEHPDKAIVADMEKLMGNSYYGRCAMNKHKFVKVGYHDDNQVQGRQNLDRAVSSTHFKKLEPLGKGYYEVESTSKKIVFLPIQVAFFVYNYAKLRLLEFVTTF